MKSSARLAAFIFTYHNTSRAAAVCTSSLSSSIYSSSPASTAQNSTAQHNTAQSALHKAANQVRAYRSATTQATRVCESQHVVEHSHSSLRSKNERRNQNLPHQKKYAWYIHNHSQSSLAGVIREDTALLEDLSPRPYGAFRECIPCSGCFSSTWSSWHLQVVSLHLKSWTSLSASFGFCCMFFLVSERSGRRKPRAERSALYHRAYMSCL